MLETVRRLLWAISAEDRGATTTLARVGRGLSDLDKTLGMVRTSIAGIVGGAGIVMIGRQMVQAATESEQAAARLTATLRATGGVIGLTRAQLDEMAQSMAKSTQFDDESFTNAQAQLVKFGNIHGEVFTRTIKLSADYAALMGTSVVNAVQAVGRALSAPAEGLSLLERQIGKLDPTTRAHIEQLIEQNRLYEAQGVILSALEARIGGTAEQMNTGLTKAVADLTKEWGDFNEALGLTAASPIVTVLSGITGELQRWRDIIEHGTWWEKFVAFLAAVSPVGRAVGWRPGLSRGSGEAALDSFFDFGEPNLGGVGQMSFEDMMGLGPADMKALEDALRRQKEAKRLEDEHWKERLRQEETLVRIRQQGTDALEEVLAQPEDIEAVTRAEEQHLRQLIQEGELLETIAQARGTGLDWLEEQLSVQEDGNAVLQATLRHEQELAREREKAAREYEKQAKEAERAWERTADNIERSLTDSIMRGGKSGLDYLRDALRTTVLTVALQPVVRPVAAATSSVVHGIFGGFGGLGGLGGLGSATSVPGYGGGMIQVGGGMAGFLGGGQLLADFGNFFGSIGATTEAGATFGLFDALGGFAAAHPLATAGIVLGALALGGAFDDKGPAERTSLFRMGFGEANPYPWLDNRWFSADMWGAQLEFQTRLQQQEQNIIRNLGLSPEQIASVNAALAGANSRRYGFGMEGTDVRASGGFEAVQAARLEAISQALGRSIEELTMVMQMSAEQWQEMLEQIERSVDQAESALAAHVRSLPDRLGITGLEQFQMSLAVSESRSPLERLAAARQIYEETLGRAQAGDLSAVMSFPEVAQQLLGIGRDVYASGGVYQELFREVNLALQDVLGRQQELQADILKDVALTVEEASQNQIAEIRSQTQQLNSTLLAIRAELQKLSRAA